MIEGHSSIWLKRIWNRETLSTLTLLATLGLVFFTARQERALVENTRISQRAWITVKAAGFIDLTVAKKPSVTVLFENTGKSPAIDVTIHANMTVPSPIPLQRGPMPLIETTFRPSVGLVGPGANFAKTLPLDHILTAEEIESLKNNKQFLYTFGQIDYRDIFRIERHTQYCFEPDSPNIIGPPRVCGQWNTAD